MRRLDELLEWATPLREAAVEALRTCQGAILARSAPHRLYGVALAWTGTEWRAAFGEGPSLIAGYGSCAAHALEDFDCVWRGQYPPRAAPA